MHLDGDIWCLRDDARALLLTDPRGGVQLVCLDPQDVMGVAQVPGGGGHPEVVAGGEKDIGNREAFLPCPLVVQIMADSQGVPLIPYKTVISGYHFHITNSLPDGYPGLMLKIPELDLASPDAGEAAILVVVVGQGPVVDHGGEVGVLVLGGAQLVAVGVRHDGQPGEVILAPEHRPHVHPVPHKPEREPVTKQVLKTMTIKIPFLDLENCNSLW